MYDQKVDGSNRHVGLGIVYRNQRFRWNPYDVNKKNHKKGYNTASYDGEKDAAGNAS